MTATTGTDPTTPEASPRAPINIVAIVGLIVSAVVIVVFPVLSVLGILLSAIGIAISHRLQDAHGGTGGYWFALAGLLIGIAGIVVSLVTFTTAA